MNASLKRLGIGIAGGLVMGLLYGWLIQPAEFFDTTPATFRDDFRTDYVLMVATSYAQGGDLNQAADWLDEFGSEPPQVVVLGALKYAVENEFSSADLQLLNLLSTDLEPASPGSDTRTP